MGLFYLILFILILIIIITGSLSRGIKIFRFFVLFAIVFFIPGLVGSLICSARLLYHSSIFLYLLLGAGTGLLFYFLVLKKFSAFGTFEHELTHAIMALFFGKRIRKFVVTRHEGGYIRYSGGYGGQFATFMITLAPYFFPTYTVILIIIRYFLPESWFPWFDTGIGMTLVYYLITNQKEILHNWTKNTFNYAGTDEIAITDIAQAGYIFSFIFISGLTLFIYSLLFYLLSASKITVSHFFFAIWQDSISFYQPKIMVAWEYITKSL